MLCCAVRQVARAHFIDDLRRFRPRGEDNKGRVLSPEILQRTKLQWQEKYGRPLTRVGARVCVRVCVCLFVPMAGMQQHRDIHTLQHYSTKRQEEEDQDELGQTKAPQPTRHIGTSHVPPCYHHADQSDDQGEGDSAPATMAVQRSHQTTTPSPTPTAPPRPRMSKRRRNKLAKLGEGEQSTTGGQWDIQAMDEEGISVAVGAYGDTKAHHRQQLQQHEVDQDGANVFERTTKVRTDALDTTIHTQRSNRSTHVSISVTQHFISRPRWTPATRPRSAACSWTPTGWTWCPTSPPT